MDVNTVWFLTIRMILQFRTQDIQKCEGTLCNFTSSMHALQARMVTACISKKYQNLILTAKESQDLGFLYCLKVCMYMPFLCVHDREIMTVKL
jgi:hypothetical protein